MMTFKNSRSRFKSNPPRRLICCLKFICLSVFLILLIAQLRAIELPARSAPTKSEILIQFKQNNTSTNTGESIDRFDKEIPDSIKPDNEQINHKFIGNYNTVEGQDHHEPQNINPMTGINLAKGQDLPNDDLISSPATAKVHTALDDSSASNPQSSLEQYPSLADMTAAGTAAGLLVHDLIAQANNLEDQSSYDRTGDNPYLDQNDSDPNLNNAANLDAQLDQSVTSDQLQPQSKYKQSDISSLDDDNDDDDESSSISNQMSSRQAKPQLLTHAEAVNNLRAQSTPADSSVTNQEAPEPSSEEASPDSIESLMGAEGADLNTNDDGQEQSEVSNDSQAQQLSDSNLINNHATANLLPQMAQSIPSGGLSNYQMANNLLNNVENDDDDDEDSSDSHRGLIRADSIPNAAAPVLMSTRYEPIDETSLTGHSPGGQSEHNLVAPMRESLVDLNAAAGHYFGKKKKVKKVKKKIVIKKKKKKKKKYKKIKIIKIKKKKKKKKKKKVMMKKHHGHDHGKYYMYAKVPKKKAWEFGFKKGNKKHWIERHEKGHKNKFKTKVQWYDKKSKGKGLHIWDYNHHDKKKKKHY